MTEKEKMDRGMLYDCADRALTAVQTRLSEDLYRYNATKPHQTARRARLLKKMFAAIGDDSVLLPPVYANWSGRHVTVGSHVFSNFNLTLVDDDAIAIGDNTLIGPNVTIVSAAHPIDPELRKTGLEFNRSVVIGRNVWLGAGVIVLPGVTIGDNSVIGAGSVVTKDVPPGVVALGTPCRTVRAIGEHDREYLFGSERIKDFLG